VHVDVSGARVMVVGLGRSGLAAVRLLASRGARVVASDARDEAALGPEALAVLDAAGAERALGGHPESAVLSVDRIIVSPGVPALPVLEAAAARGIPIASEIELAAWFLDGALVVGVTGTNGKSTVTTLVGEMIRRTGRPTFVGGNLGTPLVDVVGTAAAGPGGAVVVELSSFQLERVERFRADVAVLLNVTDDHLDRHGSFGAYAAAKARIFHGQGRGDHAVVPAGDPVCLPLARAGAAALHTFGGDDGEVRVSGDAIVDARSGLRLPLAALRLRGAHNHLNACAAALAARLAGVAPADIEAVLRAFPGLPHRMVLVRERGGVSFYDDSKATNVGATVAAIDGLAGAHRRLVVLLGGVDKGGSYAPVAERLARGGHAAVLFGQAAPLIAAALAEAGVERVDARDLEHAVAEAAAIARPGDAVLLAPACSSFDMFRSYAHRGDAFQVAVAGLPEVTAPPTEARRGAGAGGDPGAGRGDAGEGEGPWG
jgi:UDP-N-acetylmuramoylalanine--D-glutamate ligase